MRSVQTFIREGQMFCLPLGKISRSHDIGHTRWKNETFHSIAHIQAAPASPFGPRPANHNRPLPTKKWTMCDRKTNLKPLYSFVRLHFDPNRLRRREVVHGIRKTPFNFIRKLQCFPITRSVSMKEMSEYDGNQYLEMPNPTKALSCGNRTKPA